MATTRLLTIHINKGKSIAQTLSLRTDYAQNPEKTARLKNEMNERLQQVHSVGYGEHPIADSIGYIANPAKTDQGELVCGYACDPRTVDEEFLLTKKDYEYLTSRDQGDSNVLAYHIRQSFKPGEISPELALEIGYELGLRFTKGNHAFIVATHTDKAHIHNHIVFNSTALCATKKFRDFKRSGKVLRKMSDLLCLENGLSVIENPEPSKGKNYHKWLGNKEPSWQDKLRRKIDTVLPNCQSFDDFLTVLKADGYTVKESRKHISILANGQKNPTRLNTLKGEHTEESIRRRIAEYNAERERLANQKADETVRGTLAKIAVTDTVKVSFLLDIQAKIQEGKGQGYEQWAHIFNIKEMAKTLMYLSEQQIDSFDELTEKSAAASTQFASVTAEIRGIENRLGDISELQRQIGTYGKTREVYNAYKRSNFDQNFYEKNRASIALHEAARKHFDGLGVKILPKISELKEEYATLSAQKKKLYVSYHELKQTSRDLAVAKHNAEKILGIQLQNPLVENRDVSRQPDGADSPEI